MLENIRLRFYVLSWKPITLHLGLLLLGTGLFFYLHFLSNQVSYDLIRQRIADAFGRENLQLSYYPESEYSLYSVRSLVGLDQFMECQVLSAVLAGAHHADEQGEVIRRTLNPGFLRSEKFPDHYCKGLKDIVVDGGKFSEADLKTRYWWGYKALYGIMLQFAGIFEIRHIFQASIYLAYLLLAITLARTSTNALWILSPILMFGVLFSAIPYFSFVPVAAAYLWTLVSVTVLVLLIAFGARPVTLRTAAFVVGMVSSFLWFFDGHTILMVPLLVGCLYYLSRERLDPAGSGAIAIGGLCMYVAGFVGSFLLGQLVKTLYFGWVVVDSLSSQIVRVSAGVGAHDTGFDLLRPFYDLTMLGPVMGRVLSALSVSALTIATGLQLYAALRARRAVLMLDLLVPLGLILFTYTVFLIGNDNPWVFARFAFVPHALAWSCLVVAVLSLRLQDSGASDLATPAPLNRVPA